MRVNETSGSNSEADHIREYRQRRCPDAARCLLEPYEQPIYHFLRTMLHSKEDAEDATQRCFVKALNSLDDYTEQGRFKSWLYQIARTEALMLLRKRKRRTEISLDDQRLDDMPIASEPSAYLEVEAKERAEALREAIEALPDIEKEVVLLRLNAGITFREISALTEAPLNTVLGRMRNATHRLQNILNPSQS